MRRYIRKVSTEVKKQRAQRARIANREKDTIYWLVFEPKPEFAPPADVQVNLWKDPWRIKILGNPNGDSEVIDAAIRLFEAQRGIKSWREIAVRYYTDSLYFP